MDNNTIDKKEFISCAQGAPQWEPSGLMCPDCGSCSTLIDICNALTSYPQNYAYKCNVCGKHWFSTNYKVSVSQIHGTELKNPEPTYVGQMGWICPKCGGVFAPHINYCTNCTQSKPPVVSCSTNQTRLSPDDWYRENFIETVGRKGK